MAAGRSNSLVGLVAVSSGTNSPDDISVRSPSRLRSVAGVAFAGSSARVGDSGTVSAAGKQDRMDPSHGRRSEKTSGVDVFCLVAEGAISIPTAG